jgi:glutathione synthase
MVLKIAIQMNDIDKVNIHSDSTIRIASAAIKNNNELYYYTPKDISMTNGQVIANLHQISINLSDDPFYNLKYIGSKELHNMDTILIRHDPPFDNDYLLSLYFLEKISKKTVIINDPKSVINFPEKIFVTEFPDLCPNTLFSCNKNQIQEFIKKYKKVILKPIFAHGGKDIFLTHENDKNFASIISYLTEDGNKLIIAQEYIAEIEDGDKRILIANGKVVGACLRRPNEGTLKANIASGEASLHKYSLNKRDHEICQRIIPYLLENNIIFAGIDIIGDYITEINITSPTGIAAINLLENKNIEDDIWFEFEKYIEQKQININS